MECWSMPDGVLVLDTRHWFLIPTARISVDVFESVNLPAHWARLDAFEGPGYQRVVTTVCTSTGDVDASIYVLVPARPED
jgi:gamma-glutamylcyclotransferase (GGCT)/AIG2-like uncharacterized protein YtfP